MKAKIFSFLCKIIGFENFSKIRDGFLRGLAFLREIYCILQAKTFNCRPEIFSRKRAKPQRVVKKTDFGLYSFYLQ
jgi:hypothetical protein